MNPSSHQHEVGTGAERNEAMKTGILPVNDEQISGNILDTFMKFSTQ